MPRRLIWDNETGIGRGGKLADGVGGFAGTLATHIVQLRPRDPESQGIVERRNVLLGPPGTGKTHIATGLATAFLWLVSAGLAGIAFAGRAADGWPSLLVLAVPVALLIYVYAAGGRGPGMPERQTDELAVRRAARARRNYNAGLPENRGTGTDG